VTFVPGETYSHEGPQCPYCGRQYTADEPFYYDEYLGSLDCDSCGKIFKVEVYISTTWTCNKQEENENE
jgi:ribosomal protein L37AE/L43A